jgi:hypothetical protein
VLARKNVKKYITCRVIETAGTGLLSFLAYGNVTVESLSIYLWLCSPCGPWLLFQFLSPIHSR